MDDRKRVTVPRRILFGALALAGIFGVVWGDARIAEHFVTRTDSTASLLSRGSLIPLAVLLMCLAGAGEFLRLLRAKGVSPCARSGYVVIALILLAPWLGAGYAGGGDPAMHALCGTMLAVAFGLVWIGAVVVLRGHTEGALRDAGGTLLLVAYVGMLPSFLIQIRSGLAAPGSEGAWIVLALLFVMKSSDIGAYFTGTYFGRHKLAPHISPGKSVEGAIGGLILSGLLAILVFPIVHSAGIPKLETSGNAIYLVKNMLPSGKASLFLIGLLLSLSAQFGDLLESCFKRDAGIKDSGHVLPRFGGVLDLIDSPVLALPVAWMILTLTR